MEPNKFDTIFKEKLEQRTIQPREMAWDRLDAMLSVAEEKTGKPKKNRKWMYIAASFLGFLLVGTIFLKQGSSDKETNMKGADVQVAVTPEPAVKQDNTLTETAPATISETIAAEEAVAVTPITKPETKIASQKKIQARAAAKTSSPIVVEEEAMAQNTRTEVLNKPVSNEAETLLAAATDVAQTKKPAIKVNANSLLSSVEGELDNNFRSKAMQSLVKNYNTVKTSVANRNHK